MDKYIVVLITAPNDEKGQDIANHLVENHLAACVNIVPAIKSIYRWQEKICQEEEVLLMVKTREALFASIRREIRKIHPYEVPEYKTRKLTLSGMDKPKYYREVNKK